MRQASPLRSRDHGALRDELLAARETLSWVATYPEPAETFGFPMALALGLRKPVEQTLQTSARVEFANVVAALEADAQALVSVYAEQVKAKLGNAEAQTPLIRAMWSEDDAYKDWAKQERQRAIDLANQGLHDPNRLAAELRD
jgi:hypothetical protein